MWTELISQALKSMGNSAQAANSAAKLQNQTANDYAHGSVQSTYPTKLNGEANDPTTSL